MTYADFMIPDPFANTDPAWLPFDPTAAAANADLAMPDTTTSGLAEFLRSDEATKIIAATQPRPPAPTPGRGWSLANIPTFPR
jgi:hypothetical protein